MTPEEVVSAIGKPQREVSFGTSLRWTYPDLTLTFENGLLKDVKV